MMAIKQTEKREWAKLLYLKENLTQKEIAQKVDVTEKTLSKWVRTEKWEQMKASVIVTKSEELQRVYIQIRELNDFIFRRPEGERFANTKEADTLNKLTSAARDLESETSVADIIDVSIRILEWLRPIDFTKAKEVSNIFDTFIKDQLK
ncbi:MAG: DDE transposase family protein [Bacteroidales bacterium]|nr:DDE transposase family protein [Bacteroidales bacterium]